MEKYKYLELSVQYIFRANFNDSYYLETVYIDLDDIARDDTMWIDPYCGRSKIGNTYILVKSYSDEEYVIIKKQGNEINEFKYPVDSLFICSEDFDESMLLASHIKFRKSKI